MLYTQWRGRERGKRAVCVWEAEIASWAMKQLLYDQETEIKTTYHAWLGERLEGRGPCGVKYPPGNAGIVGDIKQLNVRGSYRANRWEVTLEWISTGLFSWERAVMLNSDKRMYSCVHISVIIISTHEGQVLDWVTGLVKVHNGLLIAVYFFLSADVGARSVRQTWPDPDLNLDYVGFINKMDQRD